MVPLRTEVTTGGGISEVAERKDRAEAGALHPPSVRMAVVPAWALAGSCGGFRSDGAVEVVPAPF